ncbi:unnamed protein product [Echinostoma caproni]|uniref:DDHD domain-containing protein n=1 Tax=Echinostoma caproni TaxID=27848 RepID=A0A183AGQ5_9TREM|nr:unnamed protein product [Echinostoma caproni]
MVQYRAWPHAYGATGTTPDLQDRSSSIFPSDPARLDSHTPISEHDGRVAHVRRGLDEQLLNQLDEGEHKPIDHVFFVIHGIGTIYNLRGQGLVECVNNLRRTTRQIEQSHFPHHNNRVEFLPVMWHDGLHSDATGIDEQLSQISLRSIPKLRQFTNGTLMDILFYTSSKYCQVIVDTVATEMCRLRKLFLARNPEFTGGFSVIGHSLGSVIAFDLLSHQGQVSGVVSFDEDQSTYTGCGVEEVDFVAHPPTRPESGAVMSDHLEEVLVTDRSGRSSSFGVPNELDGWSLVGYQDSQRQVASETVQPLGLGDIVAETPQPKVEKPATEEQHVEDVSCTTGCETPRAPSVSTSVEATKLADLLSRIGLTEDQIHKAVRAWLNESLVDACPPTDRRIRTLPTLKPVASHTQATQRSFWAENHYAPMSAGFGMPVVMYPQLNFPLAGLFMLGSPLPLFLTARGIRQLSSDYQLPHCAMFFNIFHPFDPVAYRMETLLDPVFQPRAVLMPHHKGGKRLHLRLKDNLARVGSDLKSKLFQSVHSTWRTLQDFALSHRFRPSPNEGHGDDPDESHRLFSQLDIPATENEDAGSCSSEGEMNFNSQLNQGRRIDYVLQEAPLESFSDYIFALGSHAAYWESEDTALFLLTEVYAPQSVTPLLPGQKMANQSQQAQISPEISPSPSVTTLTPPPIINTMTVGPPPPPVAASTSLAALKVSRTPGASSQSETSSACSELSSQMTPTALVQQADHKLDTDSSAPRQTSLSHTSAVVKDMPSACSESMPISVSNPTSSITYVSHQLTTPESEPVAPPPLSRQQQVVTQLSPFVPPIPPPPPPPPALPPFLQPYGVPTSLPATGVAVLPPFPPPPHPHMLSQPPFPPATSF